MFPFIALSHRSTHRSLCERAFVLHFLNAYNVLKGLKLTNKYSYFLFIYDLIEPEHDTTNKMTCALSKDSDLLCIIIIIIRLDECPG